MKTATVGNYSHNFELIYNSAGHNTLTIQSTDGKQKVVLELKNDRELSFLADDFLRLNASVNLDK